MTTKTSNSKSKGNGLDAKVAKFAKFREVELASANAAISPLRDSR
jgi:hypothetical protein